MSLHIKKYLIYDYITHKKALVTKLSKYLNKGTTVYQPNVLLIYYVHC